MTAFGAGECRFPKKPPATLKNMGPCHFDVETSSFAGDAVEQARCLVTPVRTGGYLNERLEKLPPAFQDYVGNAKDMPSRDALRALLRERGLEDMFGPGLSKPVSHAHDDDPMSRGATYFVIHDTSSPNFGNKAWPADIDADQGHQQARALCLFEQHRARAHLHQSLRRDSVSARFRKTLARDQVRDRDQFRHALRGLFIHNELIQPRKRASEISRPQRFQGARAGFLSRAI